MQDLGINIDQQTIGEQLLDKLLGKLTVNLDYGHMHD